MLTYDLSNLNVPIYKALYDFIKADIISGKLKSNEKLPSKRAFATNLGISTISIESAYNQLIGEGFVYAIEKKGYFISELPEIKITKNQIIKESGKIEIPVENENIIFNFSSNRIESSNFPFSIWAKTMRSAIANKEKELMQVSPCGGVKELRCAIANHLQSFRGIEVEPDRIIVGAGTEYLYGLLIKLLGYDKIYCIENPGYYKLKKIYESNKVICKFAGLDKNGMNVCDIQKMNVQIVHTSPTHHFPTGITMPVSRRYEILSWANEENGRYIIEDEYDSEFRLKGNPIPPLLSLDKNEKVIYMNTFSKSLSSTIRISYMILPSHLANEFYKKLSFYSCPVSTFEQYTLAQFISQGFFEKHINRMRLHYRKKRDKVIEIIKSQFSENQCRILENDSGLHFILEINTRLSDLQVKEYFSAKKILISSISDYYMSKTSSDKHQFILNYSNIELEKLKDVLKILKGIIE